MNVSFKSSNVNFNVISDTHGNMDKTANYVGKLSELKNDVFLHEEKGAKNIMCVVGDWFMSGDSSGYLTNPEKNFSCYQLDMFNKMIKTAGKLANNVSTVFVPGNHEFDGGDNLLSKTLSKLDADILTTNMVIDKSPAFKDLSDCGKLVNSKIIEVEDDKKQGKYHKILLLGISPVNMSYYDRKSTGVTFIDNPQIAQKNVTPRDYEKTTLKCLDEIDKFKSENPDGAVILLSHAGVHFAQNLVKRSGKINLVFDGHEHKDTMKTVGRTPILSLGKDFNFFANAKCSFDDNGKFRIKTCSYHNLDEEKTAKDIEMTKFYEQLFHKDLKKNYFVKSSFENDELSEHNIRFENNQLANFITDKILLQSKKRYKDIDIFALNASAMRNSIPLKEGASNIEIMNVLKGITDDDAQIVLNDVNGEQLAQLVVNNICFNSLDKERNPLIHYSGLTINKTAIEREIFKGTPVSQLLKFIQTDDGKTLSKDKTYKIANVKKFFQKAPYAFEKELGQHSVYTGLNAKELFIEYFRENKNNLKFTPSQRWY